jgi:hypothetical protein
MIKSTSKHKVLDYLMWIDANLPLLAGGFCWSVGCVARVLAKSFGRYRSPRAAQAFPLEDCPHQQFSVLKSGCCARLHMSLAWFFRPHPLHSNTPLLFMSVAASPAPGLLGARRYCWTIGLPPAVGLMRRGDRERLCSCSSEWYTATIHWTGIKTCAGIWGKRKPKPFAMQQ